MGSSSPTPIPFFPLLFSFFVCFFFSLFSFFFFFFRFFFFFFRFFFFFCKISNLVTKIENQPGTHTMPKPVTFQPPMHSYNVFHQRVERKSIASIGSVPEVALKKKRRFLQSVGHHRRFSESKGRKRNNVRLARTIIWLHHYYLLCLIMI